ncbi:MAG: hypothetical protein ACTSWR_08575 [Candidatus Helarchaeota archaeon]
MNDKQNKEIKIEIIESSTSNYEKIVHGEKRKKIPFKCPICKEMIILKCEIPEDIKIFPYKIEYHHKDHIILIDLDNNHEIREIRPKE